MGRNYAFVVTFDITNKQIKLYTDGRLMGTTNLTKTPLAFSASPIVVGNADLNAVLDEVAIFLG